MFPGVLNDARLALKNSFSIYATGGRVRSHGEKLRAVDSFVLVGRKITVADFLRNTIVATFICIMWPFTL